MGIKKYITNDLEVNGRLTHNGITEDTVNSTTLVEVAQASDLPASLAADTTYVIRGSVSISTAHTVTNSGCAIIGHDRNKDKIVYTGTRDFFDRNRQIIYTRGCMAFINKLS